MASKHDMMAVLDQWHPDLNQGIAARAASFLDFAAKKKPGTPISWAFVTKKVLGGSRMHNPDSKIVVDMMRRSSAIRIMLERDYKRGLENVSGLGVRATVDSDDYAQTQLSKRAKRHEASYQKLVDGRQLVDTKTMKNKKLRSWVENLAPVFSSHNERLNKLLLPPAEPEPKGNGEEPEES